MKNIKTTLILATAALLLSSCEQLITEVDAPPSESKLVVYSVISPQDSVIEVKVKKSNPLFSDVTYQWDEERFPPVINATVLLSGEGQSATIPYDEALKTYRINREAFNITPGGHYELKVMVPDFTQISAECTVPEQIPPDIEITGSGITEETGMEEWYFEFRFKDLPETGHFYLVNAAVIYQDPWVEESYAYFLGYKQGNILASDKSNDGSYFNYRTYPLALQYLESDNIWVSISLIDENYYQYAQSVNNFQNDNPFSEPTPIYSNIDGGLGVFAGINSLIKSVPTELP
ncbi:MAG: DUF4249 domain-containing protein [Lentimicrobium sp.]|jgi:hypothetical protein|nr:DUF4249 domain-containing protein [Lentimicrobium sp.]